MIRKKKATNINVDAIITSDWHIAEGTPPCRLDNYMETQARKLKEISDLQKKYDCPVFHAGDLFEKPRPSLYLVAWLIDKLPNRFETVIGNHDIPQHNIDLYNKSGVHLLETVNSLNTFDTFHWGTSIDKTEDNYIKYRKRFIAITHEMVWQGTLPWPGCTDPEIHELFDKYPKADLIITGHNHKTIVAQKDNRLIINPGSITRHKADQIDHKPCVFLYDADSNAAVPYYLKIKDCLSRDHIEIKKEKEANLQKFIESIKIENKKADFEKNMEMIFSQNKIGSKIKQIIQTWMEG